MEINKLSPPSGKVGDAVRIEGNGLHSVNRVVFGETDIDHPKVIDGKYIDVTVPKRQPADGPQVGVCCVIVPGGASNELPFRYT
ncbi:hypothetical protein QZH56_04935 [Streptomyces olivoreticuli]|uniref:hypothetical protein n=1 Tax=Streptomyces olivoreticuli TaxID=68246 RepID=UPI0026598362|nr:hypothetical protein [Streptomyces olivoreticuli]WKK24970.1 hypothetical protein QZH56_04935 [Streptomyces olivoreticuli]